MQIIRTHLLVYECLNNSPTVFSESRSNTVNVLHPLPFPLCTDKNEPLLIGAAELLRTAEIKQLSAILLDVVR